MRLHPVTWVILWMIALRLACDAILIANTVHGLARATLEPAEASIWIPRSIAMHEQEVAQTLIYLGLAGTVEVLFRIWRRLRSQRLEAIAHV